MDIDIELFAKEFSKTLNEEEQEIFKELIEKLDEAKITCLRELIISFYPEFFKQIDPLLKMFAKEIRKELRDQGHVVLGITGYPGKGKSNDVAVLSCLVDSHYSFGKNICFIPTSKEIEEMYMKFAMYSVFHIDEASRGLHKHKWHDKVQQKLNELYDTEREGHFLCTILIMPRFQNFTENFRNFMIKYWVDIPFKGFAIFYKRDEDKDAKDPWHIDENYKLKQKFNKRRVVDTSLADYIRAEQRTKNYWFYCKIPMIPKPIWAVYQILKKQSRVPASAEDLDVESYREKIDREKMQRWKRMIELRNENKTYDQIAVLLKISTGTVRKNMREIEAYQSLKGDVNGQHLSPKDTINNIYNKVDTSKKNVNKELDNKQLFVSQQNDEMENILGAINDKQEQS